MTDESHLEPVEPQAESLDELAREVRNLADEIVASRLRDGELVRRRESIKQAAAGRVASLPQDQRSASLGVGRGLTASMPIQQNIGVPADLPGEAARRDAESIRAHARQEADEHRKEAHQQAAATVAKARLEAQHIVDRAREEATRAPRRRTEARPYRASSSLVGAVKWWAIVVAALTVALCLSGNVLAIVLKGDPLPLSVNLVAISTVSCALVLTVVAEIQERLDDRISALTEFLVARLNEIETHTGDRNTGFVEGYLMWQGQEAKVVPIRSRQADRSRPAP